MSGSCQGPRVSCRARFSVLYAPTKDTGTSRRRPERSCVVIMRPTATFRKIPVAPIFLAGRAAGQPLIVAAGLRHILHGAVEAAACPGGAGAQLRRSICAEVQ